MPVGIVVIGRNEGERLRVSLASALRQCSRVCYVDSGSTDGSVALARSLGIAVVELDSATPFTAARARNAGFRGITHGASPLDAIHFLDGDCELCEGWVARAIAQMEARADLAAVFGDRREIYPERSIFSRICDIEWDGPKGEVGAFGGDVLVRVKAFAESGGFDESLIAGEEADLSIRLRRRGWKILRLRETMTLHDARMTRFSEWWKRSVRTGFAYAEGTSRYGRAPERHWVRENLSIVVWTWAVPLLSAAATALVSGYGAALLLAYPLFGARIYGRNRKQGMSPRIASLYACACIAGKFPQAVGQLRFLLGYLGGQRSRLIEYKTT